MAISMHSEVSGLRSAMPAFGNRISDNTFLSNTTYLESNNNPCLCVPRVFASPCSVESCMGKSERDMSSLCLSNSTQNFANSTLAYQTSRDSECPIFKSMATQSQVNLCMKGSSDTSGISTMNDIDSSIYSIKDKLNWLANPVPSDPMLSGRPADISQLSSCVGSEILKTRSYHFPQRCKRKAFDALGDDFPVAKMHISDERMESSMADLHVNNNTIIDQHADIEDQIWTQNQVTQSNIDVSNRSVQMDRTSIVRHGLCDISENSTLELCPELQKDLAASSEIIPKFIRDELRKSAMQVVLWNPPCESMSRSLDLPPLPTSDYTQNTSSVKSSSEQQESSEDESLVVELNESSTEELRREDLDGSESLTLSNESNPILKLNEDDDCSMEF